MGSRNKSEEEEAAMEAARSTIESGQVTGMAARTGPTGLNDRLQHLAVVSPTPQRHNESINWRSSTPPPIPPPGRSSTATVPTLVRNFSSPSLMDTSPKISPSSSHRKMMQSSNESSPSSSLRQPRLTGHELTPVTRNTSDGFLWEERDGYVVVSPEEKLHGEHLALPSADIDLSVRSEPALKPGPTLPPLPMSHRTKSMTREVGLNYPKQIGDSRRGRSFTHSTQGTSTTKRWVCKPSMKKTIRRILIVYREC